MSPAGPAPRAAECVSAQHPEPLAPPAVPPAAANASDDLITQQLFMPIIAHPAVENADLVDAELCSWAAQIGIFSGRLDQLRAASFGRFAVTTHPNARGDRIRLAARLIAALFAVDDHYCDDITAGSNPALTAARLTATISALERPAMPPHHSAPLEEVLAQEPCLVALGDVMRDLALLASPSQVARVRGEIIGMFFSMVGESCWRLEDRIPLPWEYLANRQWNGAIVNLAMIDVINGYKLPEESFDSPAVRRMTLLASNLIMYVNDLYSEKKEDDSVTPDFNLSMTLREHCGWNREQGRNETIQIHNATMRAYQEEEKNASLNASPEVLRYLADLGQWIAANLEWHLTTARYNDCGDPAASSAE